MTTGGRWAGRLLFAAVSVLVFVGVGPLTGAYRLATVLSGSMAPAMPVGSVAVLVPESPAAVRPGDVITFQAPTPDHPVGTRWSGPRATPTGRPAPAPPGWRATGPGAAWPSSPSPERRSGSCGRRPSAT